MQMKIRPSIWIKCGIYMAVMAFNTLPAYTSGTCPDTPSLHNRFNIYRQHMLDSCFVTGNPHKNLFQSILSDSAPAFCARMDTLLQQHRLVLFMRETIQIKTGKITRTEYYFCRNCADTPASYTMDRLYGSNYPRYYFEQDSAIDPFRRYFFSTPEAEDMWPGINQYFPLKNPVDQIILIAKWEQYGERCLGGGKKIRRKLERSMRRMYRRATTPEFYQVETLIQNETIQCSFQIPIRTKYRKILELHGF